MNARQRESVERLQAALGIRLSFVGESDGYVLVTVDGVTVTVGKMGGYGMPAVRSYQLENGSALTAVLHAQEEWRKQGADRIYATGHFDPAVGVDWKCGSQRCPCQRQSREQRMIRSGVKNRA